MENNDGYNDDNDGDDDDDDDDVEEALVFIVNVLDDAEDNA